MARHFLHLHAFDTLLLCLLRPYLRRIATVQPASRCLVVAYRDCTFDLLPATPLETQHSVALATHSKALSTDIRLSCAT